MNIYNPNATQASNRLTDFLPDYRFQCSGFFPGGFPGLDNISIKVRHGEKFYTDHFILIKTLESERMRCNETGLKDLHPKERFDSLDPLDRLKKNSNIILT
jgi:hypothetical protein